MKKKEFKVGDLVVIVALDPESCWGKDIHLIGVVYEKIDNEYNLENKEASGYHSLRSLSPDFSDKRQNGVYYPDTLQVVCTLEHLL